MKCLGTLLFLVLFVSCNSHVEKNETTHLQEIISSYKTHAGYDKEEYPLGLFTKAYFKKEAEFAETIIKELDALDKAKLPLLF